MTCCTGACWVFEISVLYYSVTVQFFFLGDSFVSSMIEAEKCPVLLSEKETLMEVGLLS